MQNIFLSLFIIAFTAMSLSLNAQSTNALHSKKADSSTGNITIYGKNSQLVKTTINGKEESFVLDAGSKLIINSEERKMFVVNDNKIKGENKKIKVFNLKIKKRMNSDVVLIDVATTKEK